MIIIICLESDFWTSMDIWLKHIAFTTQNFYRIEPKRRLNILNIYQIDDWILLKAASCYVSNASYSIVKSLMNIQSDIQHSE